MKVPKKQEDPWEIIDARIMARISKGEGCWAWNGYHTPGGYAQFSYRKERVYVHRVSYEIHVGPIRNGLTVDHLCNNRGCANPDHMELVTPAENVKRGWQRRRRGFSDSIRELGLSDSEAARRLGVMPSDVRRWRTGRSIPPPSRWAHLLEALRDPL